MFEDIALYFLAFCLSCSLATFGLGFLVARRRYRREQADAIANGALSPNEWREMQP